MPVAEQTVEATGGTRLEVEVSPSAAVELWWALSRQPDGTPRIDHPAIERLYDTVPHLGERLAGLWERDPTATSCSADSLSELLVLADQAGVLAGVDFAGLAPALERAARRPAAAMSLASETAEDAALIRRRLETLRRSPARRKAWVGLVAEVAMALQGPWEDAGAAAVRRACRARASQLPWGDEASMIMSWARGEYRGLLPRLLASAAGSGRPVLVVPAYWTAKGVLFDLPEHLLVGIPAQVGPGESRARTEAWARALKAIADPTRLAMADYLAATPRTVGELAGDFGLAQPTASRHVAILREAGLVAESRQGHLTRLRTDADAMRRLLDGLSASLVDRAQDDRRPVRPGRGRSG